MSTIQLSHRDRAVLRAIANGRCEVSGGSLLVDGLRCCDQFVGPRLAEAGLISPMPGIASLTDSGLALLKTVM